MELENAKGQVRSAKAIGVAKHQTKHLNVRFSLKFSGAGRKYLVNYNKVLLFLVFLLILYL